MPGPLNGHEFLRGHCRIEQFSAEINRHYVITISMNEENGSFYPTDLFQSVQFMPQKSSGNRQRKVYSSHGCHVSERRLEDDAGAGESSAQMHCGCPTERSAEYDQLKVPRESIFPRRRIGGFGVQIKAGFGYSPAALAIAPIVEDEYIQSDIV